MPVIVGGARLQAREAVGLDGAGLAQPSRQRLSPLTTRRSMARAEAAGRSSGEDRRDSRGLVCQLVCRARTRRNDVSRFVKESGEPDFHHWNQMSSWLSQLEELKRAA